MVNIKGLDGYVIINQSALSVSLRKVDVMMSIDSNLHRESPEAVRFIR